MADWDWLTEEQQVSVKEIYGDEWEQSVDQAMETWTGNGWEDESDETKVATLDQILDSFQDTGDSGGEDERHVRFSDEVEVRTYTPENAEPYDLNWVSSVQIEVLEQTYDGAWEDNAVQLLDYYKPGWRGEDILKRTEMLNDLLGQVLEENEQNEQESATGDALEHNAPISENDDQDEIADKLIDEMTIPEGAQLSPEQDEMVDQLLDEMSNQPPPGQDQGQQDQNAEPDVSQLPVQAYAILKYGNTTLRDAFGDTSNLAARLMTFGAADVTSNIDALVSEIRSGKKSAEVDLITWGSSRVGLHAMLLESKDAISVNLVCQYEPGDMQGHNDTHLHTLTKDGQSISYAQVGDIVMLDPGGDDNLAYATLRYGHANQYGNTNTEGRITRRNHRMRRDSLEVRPVPNSDTAAFKAAMKPITDKGIDFV